MHRYFTLLLFTGLTWGQIPCEDPRYLDIKKKSLDAMSDREYEYFMMKEKECMSYSSNQITEGEIALTDTVCISTKFGDINIELFPDVAPIHVENFLTHIQNGYYDGTIFHRVIPGFMIQGGDPNTKDKLDKSKYGMGGRAAKYFGIGDKNSNSTWTVPAEFSDMKHTRGILSMARGNSPNSAGSQFYICVADAPHLNGKYSVFGKVIDGLNVVDETVNLKRDKRDNPLDRIEMTISVCSSTINIPNLISDLKLSDFMDSTSYSLGADLGENLKRQDVEIDYDVFMDGLTDAMVDGGQVKIDQKKRRDVMASLQKKIRDKSMVAGEDNLKVADEFLIKNKKDNPDVKETPTGLQYRVIKEGRGDSPSETNRVKVHYSGKLIDGTKFDSSYERGEPMEFGLNKVIKGWTEGLQLMKIGSKYEFFIHPKMAYGSRPTPAIPANSLLIFEVELLDIVQN